MSDEYELSDRTKQEQEAGRKQLAINAANFERAVKARDEEAAPKDTADKAAADAAVAQAVERKGKERGRT